MKWSKKIVSTALAALLATSCLNIPMAFSASAAVVDEEQGADDSLRLTSTSNYFPSTTQTFDASTDTVTVTYYVNSDIPLLNTQWTLTYDSSVLQYNAEKNSSVEGFMPLASSGSYANANNDGIIYGSNINIKTSSMQTSDGGDVAFVTVTFDVVGSGQTTVDLNIEVMEQCDGDTDYLTIENSQVTADAVAVTRRTSVYSGLYSPETPQTDKLVVNATSNYFPTSTQTFDTTEDTVTVTYYLESDMMLEASQWALTYDPDVLAYNSEKNENVTDFMPNARGTVSDASNSGVIKGNNSYLKLTSLSSTDGKKLAFVTVTFDVVGTGTTDVNLKMQELTLANLKDGKLDESSEVDVILNSQLVDTTVEMSGVASVYSGLYSDDVQPTTSVVEPTEATEATATTKATEATATTKATQPTQATQTTSSGKTFNVTATSNFFPSNTQSYSESTEKVTVVYKINSTENLLSYTWKLTYDPTVLSFNESDNPDESVFPFSGSGMYNINPSSASNGTVLGAFYGLNNTLQTSTGDDVAFATLTFEVIGSGDTTVNLEITELSVGDPYGDTDTIKTIVKKSVVQDIADVSYTTKTEFEDSQPVTEPTVEPTEAPTEATTQAPTEEPTEAPTQAPTQEPTEAPTQAPTQAPTEAPTEVPTEAPATDLTVTASSNVFATKTQTFPSTQSEVTITYMINANANLLSAGWQLTFDSSVLSFDESKNDESALVPFKNVSTISNLTDGKLELTFSGLSTNSLQTSDGEDVVFATVVFDVVGTGNTEVNMYVDEINVGDPKGDASQIKSIVSRGTIKSYDDITLSTDTIFGDADEPVAEPTYIVAGTANLCDVTWDGTLDSGNIMTKNADGTYSLVFEGIPAVGEVQVKVVELPADDSKPIWHGYPDENNVAAVIASACDVTVTYNPSTGEITITGSGVQDKVFSVDSVRVAGNGDGTWLNGSNWDETDDSNLMQEISTGVYQITYNDVEEYDNYIFKFAANGAWNDNWGGEFTAEGEEIVAVYNGDDIIIEVPYEYADVTITLDLSNFDYATKTGATFKVDIVEVGDEPQTYIYGDVNNDGKINARDVMLIRRYLIKTGTLDDVQMLIADVNSDNKVNARDIMLIRNYLIHASKDGNKTGTTFTI